METAFSRYKKLFGEKAFSRTYERQVVENRLKCLLMNKMMRATAYTIWSWFQAARLRTCAVRDFSTQPAGMQNYFRSLL